MENCDHTQSMLPATHKVYGSVILGLIVWGGSGVGGVVGVGV